jgi:hypothetical protein
MMSIPEDAETLRLMKAFFEIKHPPARQVIIAIAKMAATGTRLEANKYHALLDGRRPD